VPDATPGDATPGDATPGDATPGDATPAPQIYTWKTGGWSGCSKPCDGGTQTRNVWCQTTAGVKMADTFCSGKKPAMSQACNTQSCCAAYFGQTVPGYMLCSETATSCSFFYKSPVKTTCNAICGAQQCLAARANLVANSCQSTTDCSPIGVSVCTCATQMLDAVCVCSR